MRDIATTVKIRNNRLVITSDWNKIYAPPGSHNPRSGLTSQCRVVFTTAYRIVGRNKCPMFCSSGSRGLLQGSDSVSKAPQQYCTPGCTGDHRLCPDHRDRRTPGGGAEKVKLHPFRGSYYPGLRSDSSRRKTAQRSY